VAALPENLFGWNRFWDMTCLPRKKMPLLLLCPWTNFRGGRSIVEYWNAGCFGWHVNKRGDRYAALDPIAQGLTALYGSTAADAARGLVVRMDHGTQYLSEHLVYQVRFWGMTPKLRFRGGAGDQRRGGAVYPDPEGAGHLWADLPDRRRGPGHGRHLRHAVQRGLVGREEQPPEYHLGSIGLDGGGASGGSVTNNLVTREPGAVQVLLT
jgi:hypothetical protein